MMNTYIEKRACKNQNEAMSHRKAVKFAKEKDETWLAKRDALTIFTKIHMTFG